METRDTNFSLLVLLCAVCSVHNAHIKKRLVLCKLNGNFVRLGKKWKISKKLRSLPVYYFYLKKNGLSFFICTIFCSVSFFEIKSKKRVQKSIILMFLFVCKWVMNWIFKVFSFSIFIILVGIIEIFDDVLYYCNEDIKNQQLLCVQVSSIQNWNTIWILLQIYLIRLGLKEWNGMSHLESGEFVKHWNSHKT